MLSPGGNWLYGFSIAHVQSYLMSGGSLKGVQGGSHILEDLCGECFEEALRKVGLSKGDIISGAAAGARVHAGDGEALKALYAVWPLIVEERAPGVVLQQALLDVTAEGGFGEAQRRLGGLLRATRSEQVRSLPSPGPLVRRHPPTGLPSEAAKGLDRGSDLRDRAAAVARASRNPSGLDGRFLPKELSGKYRFATGGDFFEEGLVNSASSYVGVIHADGNSIGEAIRSVLDGGASGGDRTKAFRDFSESLKQGTMRAAQRAVEDVLVPNANGKGVLPARPIVLGGDDLTIIVRGDLAIRFAEAFLDHFEKETGSVRAGGMTACAGVALVKHNFPFDRAYLLSESLCKRAKTHAKKDGGQASALSFFRSTTSLPGEASEVFDRELASDSGSHRLSFEAYGVGQNAGRLPSTMKGLRSLSRMIPRGQRGAYRTLLKTMQDTPAAAQIDFERACEVEARRGKDNKQAVKVLRAQLGDMTKGDLGFELWGTGNRSPLYDAFMLRALEGWEV